MQMRDMALALDDEFITTRDGFEFKVCSCSTRHPLASLTAAHSQHARSMGCIVPSLDQALPRCHTVTIVNTHSILLKLPAAKVHSCRFGGCLMSRH